MTPPTAGSNGADPAQTAPSGSGNPLAGSSAIIGVGALSATSSSQAPSTTRQCGGQRHRRGHLHPRRPHHHRQRHLDRHRHSDGTTGKVTGSTLVQNMAIAGEQVTVDANGISAAGQSTPLVAADRVHQHAAERARHLHRGHQRDRQGERALGQPDPRRAQDHHRPQDPGQRRQQVRLAPARLARSRSSRSRCPNDQQLTLGPGDRAGELDRLARLRRRQQRQHGRARVVGPSPTPPGRAAGLHRQLGGGTFTGELRQPAARSRRARGTTGLVRSGRGLGAARSRLASAPAVDRRAGVQGRRCRARPARAPGRGRTGLRLQARRRRQRAAR